MKKESMKRLFWTIVLVGPLIFCLGMGFWEHETRNRECWARVEAGIGNPEACE